MTDSVGSGAAAIVMAAGKSTRMKSDRPKVLHELCGQPLLSYVLTALRQIGIERILVVVGFKAELVRETFADQSDLEFVLQSEQKGTGHAAMMCQPALADHQGPVVVIAGDQPMIRPEVLGRMLERFAETKAKALLATAIVENPFGLGRIVRDGQNQFIRIVEQKDATPEEAAIREINPSFYVFDGPALFDTLASVRPNNAQGEYYLTDVPGLLRQRGELALAEPLADEVDMFGINHRGHLAEAHALMQQRIQSKLLDDGVTIVDPRNTSIDARARIGRDTIVEPFTVIEGPVTIGANCRIGPFAHVRAGSEIADGEVIATR